MIVQLGQGSNWAGGVAPPGRSRAELGLLHGGESCCLRAYREVYGK